MIEWVNWVKWFAWETTMIFDCQPWLGYYLEMWQLYQILYLRNWFFFSFWLVVIAPILLIEYKIIIEMVIHVTPQESTLGVIDTHKPLLIFKRTTWYLTHSFISEKLKRKQKVLMWALNISINRKDNFQNLT